MTYGVEFPRVDPQLQQDLNTGAKPPTRGADCAFKVMQGGIRWATRGAVVPTVAHIRQVTGIATGGMGTAAIVPGYQAFGVTAKLVTTFADVKAALVAGHFVHCCIDYGWVNANAPELSGQATFTGGHAIGAWSVESFPPLDTDWTAWLDPLHDHRFGGVPKQIVMARPSDLQGAMTAYGSPPKTRGVVLTQTAAPPPLPDTCQEQLAAANAQIAELTSRIQAKDDHFTTIQATATEGKAA